MSKIFIYKEEIMNIIISAESTIDIQKDLLDKFKIDIVPYTVMMGDKEYVDGEITNKDIFDFVAKNKILPRTSAINRYQYEEYFKKLLEKGDAVIHICLSSGFSSACSNAQAVAKEMKNVWVVDSKSLSTGIALLCIKAREMATEGMEPEKIVEKLETIVPKVQASFVLDKLEYLHKGGRCSGVALLGANLLSIKPQILVENGKMRVGKKFIGKLDGAVKKYCDDIIKNNPNVDLDHAFVTYSSATKERIEIAKNALKARGFKNIYETTANATVSSHCGPNTLGILFIKE